MLMFIIYEYFQNWILLISFSYLVFILSLLFKIALSVIPKILFIIFEKCKHFFLLTNNSNYATFDEALALLDRF